MARIQGLELPIVYNCSGYEKTDTLRSLAHVADIYLTDFKYMDEAMAANYSSAPDYPERAKSALEEMVNITLDPTFDESGMMQRGVIVRHLLLPGHKKNAKDVIRYVYETYGDRVWISLMNQYTPFDRLKNNPVYGGLCRRVTRREYEAVVDFALGLGVRNAFIQEGDTAEESFIPAFDGEGV